MRDARWSSKVPSLLTCVVAGCAAAPRGSPSAAAAPSAVHDAPRELALDGVVVRDRPDPLTHLEIYDPEDLFQLAQELRRTERPNDAIAVYQRLLDDFPESGFAEPARFNQGLLFEHVERFDRAAEAYTPLVTAEAPVGEERRRTWIDAHFRLAVCRGRLDDWWSAVGVFDALLAILDLDEAYRLEALVGRGIALQEAGDPASAEVALSAALRFGQELHDQGVGDDRGMIAEAAFRMGEISSERFAAVKLAFPVETLRERLEEKCGELLNAQHRYLRAIRNGDTHTVAAAGFRIGSLYERLYDDVLALEIPVELSAEQADLYREEVRNRVNVLVQKALKVYEKALSVSRSAATAAEWNTRLEHAIERLQQIYLDADEVAL